MGLIAFKREEVELVTIFTSWLVILRGFIRRLGLMVDWFGSVVFWLGFMVCRLWSIIRWRGCMVSRLFVAVINLSFVARRSIIRSRSDVHVMRGMICWLRRMVL